MLFFLKSIACVKILGKVKKDDNEYIIIENAKSEVCKNFKISTAENKDFKGDVFQYDTQVIGNSNDIMLVKIPNDFVDEYIRVEVTNDKNEPVYSDPVNYQKIKDRNMNHIFENLFEDKKSSSRGKHSKKATDSKAETYEKSKSNAQKNAQGSENLLNATEDPQKIDYYEMYLGKDAAKNDTNPNAKEGEENEGEDKKEKNKEKEDEDESNGVGSLTLVGALTLFVIGGIF